MQHTASLTSAIADRDQLVGEVIANLDETLGTVDSRHAAADRADQGAAPLGRRARRGPRPDRPLGRQHRSMTRVLADLLPDGRPLLKARHRPAAPARVGPLARRHPRGARARSSPTCPRCSRTRPGPAPTAPGTTTTSAAPTSTSGCPRQLVQELPGLATSPTSCALQAQLRRREVRPVRGRSDSQLARIGAIASWCAVLLMAAAMNLQKFPGLPRDRPTRPSSATPAACTGATWCRSPASASAASARSSSRGDYVVAHFTLDPGVEFGEEIDRRRSRCSTCWARSTSTSSPRAASEGGGRLHDPAGAHRLQLRHRARSSPSSPTPPRTSRSRSCSRRWRAWATP